MWYLIFKMSLSILISINVGCVFYRSRAKINPVYFQSGHNSCWSQLVVSALWLWPPLAYIKRKSLEGGPCCFTWTSISLSVMSLYTHFLRWLPDFLCGLLFEPRWPSGRHWPTASQEHTPCPAIQAAWRGEAFISFSLLYRGRRLYSFISYTLPTFL